MKALLHHDHWLSVLKEHEGVSAADFALRYNRKTDWPVKEIAEQLHCYPKAMKKAGEYHKEGMIYTKTALEQSSGYAASLFKATRWNCTELPAKHVCVWDMAGGLGMDTLAWAINGARVLYSEKNPEVCAIAEHNHRIHGVTDRITYRCGDAMELLKTYSGPKPALLYIDPSRRFEGKRVLSLKESQPDVLSHLPLLTSTGARILLKLSPMMDVAQAASELGGYIQFYVISVGGEVKELLAYIDPTDTERYEGADVHAVLLNKSGKVLYETRATPASRVPSGPLKRFFYEADAAIFKAGGIDALAETFNLHRLHASVGYLTGDTGKKNFPGNVYEVIDAMPYKPKKVKQWLKYNGLDRVHIHQRGFPEPVDTLYKRLGCSMGEDAHLFATLDSAGEWTIILTKQAEKNLSSFSDVS
ncbi:class I SAM-dependent methyltransferase [Balneolaceae bacterium ANBcel3]|nr:class I SAM-dependent methyltransferase [Balneolaceae bacterium ANBcel3]